MALKRTTVILIAFLFILGIVTEFIVNIVADDLPGSWLGLTRRWAVPALVIIVILVVVLTVLDRRGESQGTSEDPTPAQMRHTAIEYLRGLEKVMVGRLGGMGLADLDDFIPRTVSYLDGTDASQSQSIQLGKFVGKRRHFILYGSAGSGKSASFIQLAVSYAKNGSHSLSVEDYLFVPVLIEARMIVTRLEQSQFDVGAQLDSFIHDLLIAELCSSLGCEPNDRALALNELVQKSRIGILLLIDGFDELVWPDQRVNLKGALLDELTKLTSQNEPSQLLIGISARFEEEESIILRDATRLVLRDISSQEMQQYVSSRWPDLLVYQEEITQIVIEKLDSKPLYLRLLCQHIQENGEESIDEILNQASLIENFVGPQLRDNAKHLVFDREGRLQRCCLQEIALELASTASLEDHELKHVVLRVLRELSDTISPQQSAQVKYFLPRLFLVVEDGLWSFQHLEYRDFWLANAILSRLASSQLVDTETLLLVLRSPAIMQMTVQLLEVLPLSRATQIQKTLKGLISDSDEGQQLPHNRMTRTVAAAALSLLVRCAFTPALGAEVDCRNRCFQGLSGPGQDFHDFNFQDAILRESDFRGADLSFTNLKNADLNNADLRGATLWSADLRGANLQNARMGKLTGRADGVARKGRPTNLVEAQLANSNWFNIRIALTGYIHFWEALVLEDDVLVTTNRGQILRIPWCRGDEIITINTKHQADILDLDVDKDNYRLVTASRDRTVHLYSFRPEHNQRSLQTACTIDRFVQYPRRVAFSHSREWLGVADRAGHVHVLHLDSLLRGMPQESDPYRQHSGPAMCLVSALSPDGERDTFYSSGYDGKVLQLLEATHVVDRWKATILVDLAKFYPDDHTVRALLAWPNEANKPPTGLWLGDEGGRLLYLDLRVKDYQTHLVFQTENFQPIFSIAVHPRGFQIAYGLANGEVRIHTMSVSNAPTIESAPAYCLRMPCGDIIRSLQYVDNGKNLVIISWAGLMSVFDLETETSILKYDSQDSDWQKENDANQLKFSKENDLDQALGLSERYRKYLKVLN